ncbi:MAG: type III pantothenate kinase, partial [Muribaculaceae bacterium]|nr:type III pantothenate kinase [Muribaculaceae bacterium]
FTQAIYCSVAQHQEILDSDLAACKINAFPLSSLTPTPLTIDYSTPRTLGTDRIAAAVGAWALHPGRELLVIDAGTAITYDRVSADGHFLGGNIAPGIGMRLRSLHAFTARLPLISSRGDLPQWGDSTETAMRAGAYHGVLGEITHYASLLPKGARVVITGGWGKELSELLNIEIDYHESLVNRGLYHIFKYNENT